MSGAASREGKKYNTRYPRAPKDVQIRARRVMREMMMHLKGQEKGQKETKRKADKELLEKSRREEEARESQRAARKLNFLITQTELYSHFVGSKLKSECLPSMSLHVKLILQLTSWRGRRIRRDCRHKHCQQKRSALLASRGNSDRRSRQWGAQGSGLRRRR